MSLLRSTIALDTEPRIESESLYLRPPMIGDFREWSAVRSDSRGFLRRWEPRWPKDDLTKSGYRRRLRKYAKDRREGLSHPYFLFCAQSDRLLGGLTLSNVRRGVSQCATLGYWMGEAYAGKGHMRAAVQLVLPYCFDVLGLHRIEAACLPNNERSIALLQKVGFRQEGYARSYLMINGTWQDHILFACLADDLAHKSTTRPFSVEGTLKEFL